MCPESAVPAATCRAPHVALRFSPDGHVHACCVNDLYPLGQIGRQTVAEIWHGRPLAVLRDALDRGDYSHGCQDCESDHRQGRREQTHAEQFDRFPQPPTPLAWPLRVEFALSNTCNLQCLHCNGDLSSAIRAQREHRPPLRSPYDDAFFEELREVLPHVEVATFLGGEPFLARESRRVWDLLIELDRRPEVHVTTNGTVWDERVEHYLRALRMNVAVSIDGVTPAVNDVVRDGSRLDEVIANRGRFLSVTRSYGGSLGLNHCLLRDNWHELGAFLVEADRLDVPVHVIPVHYPSYLSLFSLPPDALRPIVARLTDSPEAVRLTRNRPVWDEALAHLRAHLADTEGGSPVSVRRGPVDRPDDALVAAIRAELTEWAGQAPASFRAPYGTIEEVEAPSWAAPLGLGTFVGRPLDAVAQDMAPLLGPRLDLRVDDGGEGFTWFSYRHELPTGEVRFRTAVVPYWGVLTATRATELPAAERSIGDPA